MLRRFIKYTSLNISAMIMASLAIFIDYFFVSFAKGADGLTGLGLGLPIYSITWGLSILLGIGGGAKYAEFKAIQDPHSANQIFTNTLKLGVLVAIPLVLLGFFSGALAQLLGAVGHMVPITADYIRVVLWAAPSFVLYNIFESFARNDDAPQIAMISSVLYSLLNIVGNFIFILWLDLGVMGSALSTAFASVVALGCLLIYWRRRRLSFAPAKATLSLKETYDICLIGGSSFMGEFLYGFMLMVFNLLIMRHAGNLGIAAFGIVSSISYVVYYILLGLGQGIQPLASEYHAKKDQQSLKKLLRYAMTTNALLSLIILTIVMTFTQPITGLLNTGGDPYLAQMANAGAQIYFMAFAFMGLSVVSIAYLSVTSLPEAALWLSFLQGGSLIIPIVWVLAHFYGMTGIWFSYPVSEVFIVLTSIYYLIKSQKKAVV